MAFKINIFRGKQAPWYDRAIVACLYAALILIPLVFLPAFYTVFSLPKLVVLRVVTLAVALLWTYKIQLEQKFTWYKSRFAAGLFFYGLVCAASSVFSIAPLTSLLGTEGSFVGLATMIDLLFLAYAGYHWLRSGSTSWQIIIVTAVTSSLLAFYGILQFFGIFQESFNWSEDPSARVFGTIGHANHFGAYLAMNIILTLFLFERYNKKKHRVIIGAGILLQVAALALTGSRGALLALILGFLYLLEVFIRSNYRQAKELLKKYLLPIVITLAVFILILALGMFRVVKFELTDRIINNITFMQEGHLPDRVSWWLSSLDMVSDRPLMGFGLATFRDAYNQYRRRDFATQAPGQMQDLITPEAAHNEYLNTAVTQGVLGLVLFIVMIYLAFRPLPEKQPPPDFKKDPASFAFKGALVVYLAQIFFNFGVIATLSIFFLLLGIIAAGKTAGTKLSEIKLPLYYRIPLLFVILAAVCLSAMVTWRQAGAEYYYKQAVTAAAEKNYDRAIVAYQSAINELPLEYAYPQEFADYALKTSDDENLAEDTRLKFLNLAQMKYGQAITLNNHHPSTFYNLGLTQLQIYLAAQNQLYLEKALQNFGAAQDLAVNNPLYPYQIGLALSSCPEPQCREEAKKSFAQALQIRPGFRDAEIRLKQLQDIP